MIDVEYPQIEHDYNSGLHITVAKGFGYLNADFSPQMKDKINLALGGFHWDNPNFSEEQFNETVGEALLSALEKLINSDGFKTHPMDSWLRPGHSLGDIFLCENEL